MDEKKLSGEILDAIWKAEKIALDFHGGQISMKQFMKIISGAMLELTGLLINLHLLKTEKEG